MAGLEKAIKEETATEVELAIRRIALIHGIILTAGGIPLIYLGDEIGTLNDYDYHHDPAKAADSRWVHRPKTNWKKMAKRNSQKSIEGNIYQRMHHLVQIRKREPAFIGNELQAMDLNHPHVLGFVRQHQGHSVIVLANFSEQAQSINGDFLRQYGAGYTFTDLVTGQRLTSDTVELEPYALMCVRC